MGEKDLVLRGGRLVTPEGIRASDLRIEDGRLTLRKIEGEAKNAMDLRGDYVVPGFIDIHFHGYDLFGLNAGLYQPDRRRFDSSPSAYRSGFQKLTRTLPKHGVTGFFVATWASPIINLRRCFERLHNFISNEPRGADGARLHGAFLEGSFINPEMSGAQNPEYALPQSLDVFESLEDRGTVKLVNVVPDFGSTSIRLIEDLDARGLIIGAGHTRASGDQIARAVEAGLAYAIHFTNGPTGGSYKPFDGGGAIEGVLKEEKLYAELILDGYHINPAYVRDVISRKGIDRIIAVTDAIYGTGSSLEKFEMEGVEGRPSEDGRYFYVVDKPGALFSSNRGERYHCGSKDLLLQPSGTNGAPERGCWIHSRGKPGGPLRPRHPGQPR
jgi:N-acetylglucosamine-6-phosphate deacetylase